MSICEGWELIWLMIHKQRTCKHEWVNESVSRAGAGGSNLRDRGGPFWWTCAGRKKKKKRGKKITFTPVTVARTHTHTHIYPVSLWTGWTSQTSLSSSQWGQPAWPLGVTNMQFTQPDSRGSSESVHSRGRGEEERGTSGERQLQYKLQYRHSYHVQRSYRTSVRDREYDPLGTKKSEPGLCCATTAKKKK